jgi:hypothetical protein
MYSHLKKKYFESLALKPLELYVNLVGLFNAVYFFVVVLYLSFSLHLRGISIPTHLYIRVGVPRVFELVSVAVLSKV